MWSGKEDKAEKVSLSDKQIPLTSVLSAEPQALYIVGPQVVD